MKQSTIVRFLFFLCATVLAVDGFFHGADEQDEIAAVSFDLLQLRAQKSIQQYPENASLLPQYMLENLDKAELEFHHAPALVAAFRLNLFDSIPVHDGATFDEILQRTNSTARGMDALLQVMISIGVVTYEDDTKRFYNEFSKHVARADADRRKTLLLGYSVSMQRQLYYLADTIREGRPVGLTTVLGDYPSLYEARADIPEVAKDWDPFMDLHNTMNARNISRSISFVYDLPSVAARIAPHPKEFSGHVLDWCGNQGINAIELAKSDPTMHLTVLDLPAQVAQAAKNIEAEGLQGQIDTMGVDLLDLLDDESAFTFEHKYDAVLMLHMEREWDSASLRSFFRIIISSVLKPGGIIALTVTGGAHSIGNFSNFDPQIPALSNLYFLEASNESHPKTIDEVESMLTSVGFVNASLEENVYKFVYATKP